MTHLRLGLKLNAMHLFISGFERLDSSRKYSQLSTEFICASWQGLGLSVWYCIWKPNVISFGIEDVGDIVNFENLNIQF